MKLELKHLAPYLPYGFLYGIYDNEKVIIRGLNYNSDYLNIDYDINEHNKVSTNCFYNEIKPILRKISDLTKEIEVNGERFVPIEKLFEFESSIDRHLNYLEIEQQSVIGMKYIPFGIVNKLFEWHFDVFGLIEDDLAIDFNTLSK
jgi:hypothetical protein